LTRNAVTVYMALPGTVSADDLKSPLEEPKQIAPQAALFSSASLEHSSAHFRQASAQRENASISACLSQALASSSQARAQTSQSGYAYFEPRSSSCVVRVAIRAIACFAALKRCDVYKLANRLRDCWMAVDADRQYWLIKGVFVRCVCLATYIILPNYSRCREMVDATGLKLRF